MVAHVLHPLPRAEWINISSDTSKPHSAATDAASASRGSALSISEGEEVKISQSEVDDEGIIIDANREIRAKIYMGHVRFAHGHVAHTMLMPLPVWCLVWCRYRWVGSGSFPHFISPPFLCLVHQLLSLIRYI